MENVRAENGRVLFSGTQRDIARANINLRTGERVLLVVGHVRADTFDRLFEGVRNMRIHGVFWPGIVVMLAGAVLALGRGRIAPKRANAVAAVGLALACAGALMTVAL